MKKLIAAVFALTACAGFADAKSDAEEGGRLCIWPKDHGKFLFVNAQKTVEASRLDRPIGALAYMMNYDITLVPGTAPDIRAVKAELTKLGAKGAIWIVEDPALPLALGAFEDGWGYINVAPLVADKPDTKKLDTRIEKMIYRTFGNIHGTSDSQNMPQCVMKSAVGLAGIDALLCSSFSPEPYFKANSYMAKAGYKHSQRGTYYEACEGGWAPAPTNDVQKSIWDEVHQLPTKPIKILPPSKQKK